MSIIRAREQPLFPFRLKPLADVDAWGGPGARSLHWFGLTDGWYGIHAGTHDLFRTADLPDDPEPWIEYPIVRLWEDVLEILPYVLEAVPRAIAERLHPARDWAQFYGRAVSGRKARDPDEAEAAEAILLGATAWVDDRQIDTQYLVGGPQVYVVRVEARARMLWDNRNTPPDEGTRWHSEAGLHELALDDYVAEARDLDARLMAAMAARIIDVQAGRAPTDVSIDLVQLEREHAERSTWLDAALAGTPGIAGIREPQVTDWDEVTRCLEALDTAVGT